MLRWLSGIDVNAVFLALMAAWGYLHNHRFRVAVANGQPPPMSPPLVPPSTTSLVFAVLAVPLLVLACAGSAKARAQEQAVDVCIATATAEFAVAAKAGTASNGQVALQLSVPTALCIWNALHVQAPTPETLKLVDAGS